MNGAGFLVCAVLLVLSCSAAVILRTPRLSLAALAAVPLSLMVFLVVAGEYLLSLLEVIVLLGTLAGVVEAARRGAFGTGIGLPAPSRWAVAGGMTVLVVAVLDGAALAAGSRWHTGGPKTGLGGVLASAAPVTSALLAVALGVAIGIALIVGRMSADEVESAERRRARREREERMRRRREDRAAAREARRPARPTGVR
jgi:hypothetical protein